MQEILVRTPLKKIKDAVKNEQLQKKSLQRLKKSTKKYFSIESSENMVEATFQNIEKKDQRNLRK